MAVKKFFGADGVLHEIDLGDGDAARAQARVPFGARQVGEAERNSVHALLAPDNPLGVDPTALTVDAASVPDLKPTRGAAPTPKFPDPLPGSGEGAGVGQASGAGFRDAWANNPARPLETPETLQSGPVGSAAAVADTDRQVGGSTKSPAPADGEEPDDTWTKAQLAEYAGVPETSGNKAELLEKAKEAHAAKQLA